MSVRVQFVLGDDEYKKLKELADIKGVSISKYVKDRVFPEEQRFEDIWEEFCNRLTSFPANAEFDVSIIMSQERWRTLDRSTKLSIARLFMKKVKSKEFDDIEIAGRSPSNVSLYVKRLH